MMPYPRESKKPSIAKRQKRESVAWFSGDRPDQWRHGLCQLARLEATLAQKKVGRLCRWVGLHQRIEFLGGL